MRQVRRASHPGRLFEFITEVGPHLAAIQGVAVRILRTPDAAIVSVAAPPHTKDALERELRLLVTEMRLRDLVHVVAR